MSLDERLRGGLQRSAARGGLDEDEVLDDVRRTHERGRMRARIIRGATAAAVIVTLFAGVVALVSWRTAPGRYGSTALVRVGAPTAFAPDPGALTIADLRRLALAPVTLRKTLIASHLAPDDTRIHFRVTSPSTGVLAMSVTGPTSTDANMVPRHWAAVFSEVRHLDAKQQIKKAQHALTLHVAQLHRELQKVDAQLSKLDPKDYNGLLLFDAPNANLRRTGPNAPPPVPEQGSVHLLNLAFERIQLLSQLTKAGEPASLGHVISADSKPITIRISQTPASRVDTTPPAAWGALAGWLVALVLLFVVAFLVYRLRSKSARLEPA